MSLTLCVLLLSSTGRSISRPFAHLFWNCLPLSRHLARYLMHFDADAVVMWFAFLYPILVERTEYLFLFLFARSILSAAIRLNLIGPYQGQQVLTTMQPDVEHIQL